MKLGQTQIKLLTEVGQGHRIVFTGRAIEPPERFPESPRKGGKVRSWRTCGRTRHPVYFDIGPGRDRNTPAPERFLCFAPGRFGVITETESGPLKALFPLLQPNLQVFQKRLLRLTLAGSDTGSFQYRRHALAVQLTDARDKLPDLSVSDVRVNDLMNKASRFVSQLGDIG